MVANYRQSHGIAFSLKWKVLLFGGPFAMPYVF